MGDTIQWEPEHSGIGRWLSESSYNFKKSIEHKTQQLSNQIYIYPSDLSKILVKKQMKYFDVPLEHEWKVPVLNTRMNNLMNNVEGFNDYVKTEMINMLCSE